MDKKHSVGRTAALLAVVALIPLCAAAGLWQIDRAAQKAQHAAQMQVQAELPPVIITGGTAWSPALIHRTATVRGEFEPERAVRVRRTGSAGASGFDRFEPLRLEGSDVRLLVNRGWFAEREGPRPIASDPPALQEVYGLIAEPALPPLRLGGVADFGGTGHWPWIDPADFARLHGVPVLPFILITEPQRIAQLREAGQGGRAMHIGYAIQWFAFAILATALAALMITRRRGAGR